MGFLLFLWILFIFIGTCTKDVHAFLDKGEVEFVFTLQPELGGFVLFYPPHQFPVIDIFGHFIMFYILTALLLTVMQNIRVVVLLAISYGLLTEFLQFYFGRDGDIYDFIVDIIGVISYVSIYLVVHKSSKHMIEIKE
ncbi:VanZ family protein [Aquibacillus albus]|uniref:VanZ family protein n=1 Tax=Aquibacillus albus TaxID=1168171 RepID=A0ABS2MWX5_9BACI|nr:VanZ family protein [Aquibacillus albus]MBM7570399.1 VanZ family protein [Aquibacillus albus]